jgi:CheY-like chemotaxis protein
MEILIVSTDYDTRTIFATALRSAGYTVRELADPAQVVSAAEGCALVVTDYPTPAGASGTVTALLRNDPRTYSLKILNATTHAFWDEIAEAEAAGVDATLVLPATPARLIACVGRLLADREDQQAPADPRHIM